MNDTTPTPLDAISPLLRQVEELRKTAILESAKIVIRLQAKAWYEGYQAGISDAVRPATSASRDNPYDFVAGVPAPDPATGNPAA